MKTNTPQTQKPTNRQLLITFLTAFAINLILIGYHTSKYGLSQETEPVGPISPKLIIMAVIGMAIALLILCLAVSVVLAFILNRELPYKTRLTRIFLITSSITNIFMVIKVLIDSI